jgi:hypothetical protein
MSFDRLATDQRPITWLQRLLVILAVLTMLAWTAAARAEEPPTGAPPPQDVAAPADGEACDADAAAPELFWLKAMRWIDGKHPRAGKLLLRDLARDYPKTPRGLQASQWLEEHAELDHSGRVEFIIGSTLMGAYFGYTLSLGLAGDDMDEQDSFKTATWTSVGGAALGLTASALTAGMFGQSNSQSLLYNFAGSWGFMNGFMVYDLVSPLNVDDALVSGAIGMAVGVGTSLALWPYLDVDEGAAQMTMSLSSYTLELLFLTTFAVGGPEVYRDQETIALLALLLPANGAAIGGFFLGQELGWTAADIRYISLGGILGNLLGAAVLITAQPEFEAGMATQAGIVAGSLVASTLIVRPWRHAHQESQALRSGALIHLDDDGVHLQPPLPNVRPFSHQGRLAWGMELPILSSEL